MRGLKLAIPLSLALWGGLYVVARGAVSPDYRHGLKAQAHHVLVVSRHDLRSFLTPRRQG